jgi:hydrogenase nickel incorporation protein HypA/HybF
MHELSIAQSIIQIVEKSFNKNSGKRIESVTLLIGQLSGIEVDALEFSFSIIKNETVLHNVELVIEKIEGQGKCQKCNMVFAMNKYGMPCPSCQSYNIDILKGKEMKVLRINVAD